MPRHERHAARHQARKRELSPGWSAAGLCRAAWARPSSQHCAPSQSVLHIVLHCPLFKPQFMFLDKTPESPLKAIDFGISVFCKPGQYVDVRAGTPIYIAPEVGRCVL